MNVPAHELQEAERDFVQHIEAGRVHCQVEIEAPTTEQASIFLNVYTEAGQTCNLRQPVVYSLKFIKDVEDGCLTYADSVGRVVVCPPQSVLECIATFGLEDNSQWDITKEWQLKYMHELGRKESCGLSMNSERQT
jgi:hypothetical protein